ncbi:MAG TPA: hypothetical protein GXX33_03385 [Firmicutes bacterium]|uniref:Uncharacterized protein n=1 Tax=Capillibacterium thermochitinicola TaxID=2699427 RepID=A0A8J6I1M8_9FIRM|nr:hypothetical protein [Capillibacterium thermochitinicola]MBA2132719.1 hypothetical protein [Capillibacterium thermochitinicola]HHW12026.1 hypothetical protein [Bacillota bacterium]
MKMFWSLYRKELSGARNTFLILCGLILSLDVFLATRIKAWGYKPAFVFTFLPLAFLIFWGFFRPLSLTRGEWREGTAPFLRSLPVSGWSIIGAKLLAAFTEWVGLNLTSLALSGLFYAAAPLCGAEWVPLSDLPPVTEIMKILTAFGTNYALGIFLGAAILQLSYLIGRLVNRFTGLVSFASTVFLVYISAKVSELLTGLLSFLPGLSLNIPQLSPDVRALQALSITFIVMLIEFALLFFITGWIMEKKMEF